MVCRSSSWRWTFVAVMLWNAGALVARGEEYKSYDSAMAAANRYLIEHDYVKAQEPLEAALKLATKDEERLLTYSYLMQSYRLLPTTDKMVEACEFTIAHTKRDAERSLTSHSLASFLFQRGKLDQAREGYEKRLGKTPGDLVALSMLATIARSHAHDQDKYQEYKAELDKVQRARSGKLAEVEEQLAKDDPERATFHWCEAAMYWMRAADHTRSVAAAKAAEAAGPDKRSELLIHFWHAHLADVYLAADKPQEAIPHLEQAIATTNIAGYKAKNEEKLAQAKAKLKQQEAATPKADVKAKKKDKKKEKAA